MVELDNVIKIIETKCGFKLHLYAIVLEDDGESIQKCCDIAGDWIENGGKYITYDVMTENVFNYYYNNYKRIKEYVK